MGKICIIEDEKDIADTLVDFFRSQNYEVTFYYNAEEFYNHFNPDFRGLYLVDWNLPGEPGINIISKIRAEDKVSGIFMLSAYSNSSNIMTGLKHGADDYITKPFSLEELLLRVENIQLKIEHVNEKLSVDEFQLLSEACTFIKSGVTVNLTQREFVIFTKLYSELSKSVTREELIECFDKDQKVTVRNIDVHIFSLRKKIKSVDFLINTIRGQGYKLVLGI